ncbi:MAG: hypothetical protein IKJ94_05600 [Oscillospiraceae bacterium]|nr:hypothetical protein [Oscillospiraceae bacterium]
MFGYVMASLPELDKQQKKRYSSVYCGICRGIRDGACNAARLGLSYDMAFLALLLMSLYEPRDREIRHACALHPMRKAVENEYIQYAADMNVLLLYYKCLDDIADENKLTAKGLAAVLASSAQQLEAKYPRQSSVVKTSLEELSGLEKENCPEPDKAAGCFGRLLGEILVYRQDHWEETLRQLGYALGRYIYLADAAVDYKKDKKRGRYNPFVAQGAEECDFEALLVLAMSRCVKFYEHLPLVQDKEILDNILYSGVWLAYRRRQK